MKRYFRIIFQFVQLFRRRDKVRMKICKCIIFKRKNLCVIVCIIEGIVIPIYIIYIIGIEGVYNSRFRAV